MFGPLAPLVGIWEGDKGDDIAPSDSRGIENNKFRERIAFEPMGLVQNHEQSLFVLRYSTRASRIGSADVFHEELGYWSWEPATQQVMRCFLVPRGIALIAGGTALKDARELHLKATNDSKTFGICANPFLDREFRTLSYELHLKILSPEAFSYAEDTVMKMPSQASPFHHRDSNTLVKVQSL